MTDNNLDFPEELVPSKEELKETDKQIGILVLTRGEKINGEPFYAYLSVPPSKYQAFLEAEQQGNYSLNDYGEVLRVGNTLEPPDDIKQLMEDSYGANHNFQEEVIKKAQEINADESKKRRLLKKFGIKKKNKG